MHRENEKETKGVGQLLYKNQQISDMRKKQLREEMRKIQIHNWYVKM